MTKDEIMRMARDAGIATWNKDLKRWSLECGTDKFVTMIEAKVSAAEREACAQVVDDFGDEWMCDSHELSKIIRARGQK